MQFANALEATWIIVLTIQVFRRNTAAGVLRRVTNSPTLMFCLAFTLILALGTGLSTANLGTLSRYRAPMMPFFFTLLFMLRVPESELTRRAATKAPAGSVSSREPATA